MHFSKLFDHSLLQENVAFNAGLRSRIIGMEPELQREITSTLTTPAPTLTVQHVLFRLGKYNNIV
jgi:hypothetical protein